MTLADGGFGQSVVFERQHKAAAPLWNLTLNR